MAGIVPLVFGAPNSRTVNADETADQEPRRRVNILECPQCCSNRTIILDTTPLRACCADCNTTYSIKTIDPHYDAVPQTKQRPGGHKRARGEPAATPDPRDIGATTEFIDDAIKRGPEGFRAAQREANRLSRKFGVTFEPEWLLCTKWLKDWTSGSLGTRANGLPLTNGREQRGERDSRVRVRVAIAWRARWLCIYAMSASKIMACRTARVGHSTADYHLKNDADFRTQAEAAKAHAIDLLHTRMMQRALEGDIEPVFRQGVCVDHVRKFDSRLQIEMARAHMPDRFKTPGQALVNIETGDKILVMDEAIRAKLIERRKEKLLGFKAAREVNDSPAEPKSSSTLEGL
jgi:hypothetical protein